MKRSFTDTYRLAFELLSAFSCARSEVIVAAGAHHIGAHTPGQVGRARRDRDDVRHADIKIFEFGLQRSHSIFPCGAPSWCGEPCAPARAEAVACSSVRDGADPDDRAITDLLMRPPGATPPYIACVATLCVTDDVHDGRPLSGTCSLRFLTLAGPPHTLARGRQ
jgi:hypothetical protein